MNPYDTSLLNNPCFTKKRGAAGVTLAERLQCPLLRKGGQLLSLQGRLLGGFLELLKRHLKTTKKKCRKDGVSDSFHMFLYVFIYIYSGKRTYCITKSPWNKARLICGNGMKWCRVMLDVFFGPFCKTWKLGDWALLLGSWHNIASAWFIWIIKKEDACWESHRSTQYGSNVFVSR